MKVRSLVALVFALLASSLAMGQEPRRWASLDDGLEAAKKSGRPVLVVTRWRGGVCNTCDAWQERVGKEPEVQKQIVRFEQVEWLYDGQGGKVISWTKEHGGTSDDPAVQAFVVAPDGGRVSRAPLDRVYVPSDFARWLKEEADAFDKAHPTTKLRFELADVKTQAGDPASPPVCPAIDAAKQGRRVVLLYVTRGEREAADKTAKAEAAASRKLEKGALDSDQAAKAVAGWTLVKIDLADADAAAYAKYLGVEKAPALVVFVPSEEKPQPIDLASVTTGESLAFKLRKFAAK